MSTQNLQREPVPVPTGSEDAIYGHCPECGAPCEFLWNSISPGEGEMKSTYRCTDPHCGHEVACTLGTHP